MGLCDDDVDEWYLKKYNNLNTLNEKLHNFRIHPNEICEVSTPARKNSILLSHSSLNSNTIFILMIRNKTLKCSWLLRFIARIASN